MRVILVGIYPPPIGGVSIHLQRLLHHLETSGIPCLLLDLSGERKARPQVANHTWASALRYLFVTRRSIVHFHNFSPRNAFLFFLLSLRHRTILTFHNEWFLDELNAHGRVAAALGAFFLNRLDRIVVISEKCRALAFRLIRDKRKITLIPSYLEPATVPVLAHETIQQIRSGCRFLIGSNAFQISFYNGQDLYGIDLLVELMRRLVHGRGLDVALVFLLPSIGDHEYFNRIRQEVDRSGLADRILFITGPTVEVVALWQVCDLVVRATNTDGNSLTIMEALSLGTPVVASDCVDRPPGTLPFVTRDVDDLERNVVEVLLNLQEHRQRVLDLEPMDNGSRLLALYRHLGASEVLRPAGIAASSPLT